MTVKLTGILVLTDERPECRYGIPVLVNRQEDAVAYGPADLLYVHLHTQPAAHWVRLFGQRLTGDERAAACRFLKQWPEGPQLD